VIPAILTRPALDEDTSTAMDTVSLINQGFAVVDRERADRREARARALASRRTSSRSRFLRADYPWRALAKLLSRQRAIAEHAPYRGGTEDKVAAAS